MHQVCYRWHDSWWCIGGSSIDIYEEYNGKHMYLCAALVLHGGGGGFNIESIVVSIRTFVQQCGRLLSKLKLSQ